MREIIDNYENSEVFCGHFFCRRTKKPRYVGPGQCCQLSFSHQRAIDFFWAADFGGVFHFDSSKVFLENQMVKTDIQHVIYVLFTLHFVIIVRFGSSSSKTGPGRRGWRNGT